jgi:hypothetical protein
MKFLCLYKPGKEDDRPPSQEEMATMGKLIDDMTKAGVRARRGLGSESSPASSR